MAGTRAPLPALALLALAAACATGVGRGGIGSAPAPLRRGEFRVSLLGLHEEFRVARVDVDRDCPRETSAYLTIAGSARPTTETFLVPEGATRVRYCFLDSRGRAHASEPIPVPAHPAPGDRGVLVRGREEFGYLLARAPDELKLDVEAEERFFSRPALSAAAEMAPDRRSIGLVFTAPGSDTGNSKVILWEPIVLAAELVDSRGRSLVSVAQTGAGPTPESRVLLKLGARPARGPAKLRVRTLHGTWSRQLDARIP